MDRASSLPASRHLPLALTMGDPSGIGPELALKAWAARQNSDAPFFILGDVEHLSALAQRLKLDVPCVEVQPDEALHIFATALPVVPLTHRVTGVPGTPDPADAAATIQSIEQAVALVKAGDASAIVTNPIAKEVLYASGFRYPGHTEFLGHLSDVLFGVTAQPVMMLWSPDLAVVPATIHVALSAVPKLLTVDLLLATTRIVAQDLRQHFGLATPRIVLTGLNPHAGEGGAMGREEIEIIAPAIAILRAEGLNVTGPHPADTLFHAAKRSTYDVVIAMYHDQALIPLKTLAFDSGVNVTLGLPFVRTSPDHGTAFDIAGQGLANPASLIEALRLAARLTGERA